MKNSGVTDNSSITNYSAEQTETGGMTGPGGHVSETPGMTVTPVMAEALHTLKQYYGYDSFRPGQETLVGAILGGRDALGIMPTGAGKSICYQVPAMLLPGVTIVVSPLISLMKDQVQALTDNGMPAAFINSTLSEPELRATMDLARFGQYRILYVAPERLETGMFRRLAENIEISMVAVDEAHCISQWGQDFRPSYTRIADFVDTLPVRPVVAAFTATATDRVKRDILERLRLKDPELLVTGFDRPNLYFSVERPRRKRDYVLLYIRAHARESGIIYCSTRKNVDELYAYLAEKGVSIARYHAGLSPEERKQMQEDFLYDRRMVMVATNAFGMGIDKSNVRYVLHYNMPSSVENYYQEAGRAGRDGEPAECVLLFSPQDVIIQKTILRHHETPGMEGAAPDPGEDFSGEDPYFVMLRQQYEASEAEEQEIQPALQKTVPQQSTDFEELDRINGQRLQRMEEYCRTTGCLRHYILRYFGETVPGGGDGCGSCGNCRAEYLETDITEESKKIINAVYETGQRFGASFIAEILMGSESKKMKQWHAAERYRMYGVLRQYSTQEIRRMIEQLLLEGYLLQTDDGYPVLRLTGLHRKLKDPDARVVLRTRQETPAGRYTQAGRRAGDGWGEAAGRRAGGGRDDAAGRRAGDRRGDTVGRTDGNGRRDAAGWADSGTRRGTAGQREMAGAAGEAARDAEDEALFEKLKTLRLEIAREEHIPPYIVFSDRTLRDLARKRPVDNLSLLGVYGIGSSKAEKYGSRFLQAIRDYEAARTEEENVGGDGFWTTAFDIEEV